MHEKKCENLFVGTFEGSRHSNLHEFIKAEPIRAKEESFSETIRGVSTMFIAIYNQAIEAEAAGLEHVSGIGLRKALEFLVKDFAIKQNPDEAETIKSIMLGKCIENHIESTKIKECAKRAAWLGNDETHYTKKWDDKDVEDLKLLIKLTVNWIEMELLTEHYTTDMTEGSKSDKPKEGDSTSQQGDSQN